MESDCKTCKPDTRPPLSPLPSTLRCCPRDDTVCTYCGVSYLVLHEIADLEAKILLLEKNQDGEVEWARGALQAACQALVQRELRSARASAESRIQALAEVYDQERAQTREQQRQVLERARAVYESAHKLAEGLFPCSEEGGGDGAGDCGAGDRGAVEYLERASRCLVALDGTLRSTAATADELHAARRRARQAETELVQARVQGVSLQEEAERARREAEQAVAALQEARAQAQALRAQAGEEAAQAARSRDKMRLLTGQAELWRGVARSLEEEKVVQERMLAELGDQIKRLRASKTAEQPQQRDDEDKRRVSTECVSLRGALRESHEEISSLRGQKVALQSALRRLESNVQRSAEERQALSDALQSARQSHALESECRRSLVAERGAERGAWQEERSWLVAERARAEAESAALRNTCLSLQVRAEQCAQQCARMEGTVLRQCEERDALLRALPGPPGPDPAEHAEHAEHAEPHNAVPEHAALPAVTPVRDPAATEPLMQVQQGPQPAREAAAPRPAVVQAPSDLEFDAPKGPTCASAATYAVYNVPRHAVSHHGPATPCSTKRLAVLPAVPAKAAPSGAPSPQTAPASAPALHPSHLTAIGRHLVAAVQPSARAPLPLAVQQAVVAQMSPTAQRIAAALQPALAVRAAPDTSPTATAPPAHLSTTAQRIAAVLQQGSAPLSPTAQRLAAALQSSKPAATAAGALRPSTQPAAPLASQSLQRPSMVFTIEASRPPNARRGGALGGGRRGKKKCRK